MAQAAVTHPCWRRCAAAPGSCGLHFKALHRAWAASNAAITAARYGEASHDFFALGHRARIHRLLRHCGFRLVQDVISTTRGRARGCWGKKVRRGGQPSQAGLRGVADGAAVEDHPDRESSPTPAGAAAFQQLRSIVRALRFLDLLRAGRLAQPPQTNGCRHDAGVDPKGPWASTTFAFSRATPGSSSRASMPRAGTAPPWCSISQPRGGHGCFWPVRKKACGNARTAPPLRRVPQRRRPSASAEALETGPG